MSAQLKYSAKKSAGGESDRAGFSDAGRAPGPRTRVGMPAAFIGRCDGLKNFIFDYGAPSHPEQYRKSREALLDYIRVEYDEGDAVAESILGGAPIYPPKPSDPPDGASRTDEEIWKREVARYVNARADIDKGLKQAYTLMWGQCTERLRDKLETGSNYAVVAAAKDVFALDGLVRMQAHETMDTRRKKAWTAIDVKAGVLNFLQEQSSLNDIDFYREFAGRIQGMKTARVSIGRDDCVMDEILRDQGLTEATATQAQKEAAKNRAEEQSTVMLYLRNINQSWHGSMVRYLEDAYATGNDIYPTSLPDAYRFLDDWKTRHRVRGKFTGGTDGITMATADGEEKEGKQDDRFVIPGKEQVLCWDCNYYGHRRGNKICPNYNPSRRGDNPSRRGDPNNAKKAEQVNATTGGAKARSGVNETNVAGPAPTVANTEVPSLSGRGHESSKSQSTVSWTVPAAVAAKNESVSCTVGVEDDSFEFSFFQTPEVTDWGEYILLDNQSTCHVFKNKSLLSNIQSAKSPIAIHSTAGVTYADSVGFLRNFPDPIYIYEDGIANILSFAKVRAAGWEVRYDHDSDAFIVQGPTRTVTFSRLPSGLYGCRVPRAGVCLVDTVDSRAEGYSPRQVASAKAARRAMSMMGSPSAATFRLMIRDNLVNNCPVTLNAVKVATDVFGPDVATLQGKTTRRTPDHVDPAVIDIPPEIISRNMEVIVVADLMFVNGLPFLVSISRNITLITVSYMPSRTAEDLRKGMRQIVSLYERRGLVVTTAMVDNQFNPLRGLIGTVDLNVTAASEHAPEIERCI